MLYVFTRCCARCTRARVGDLSQKGVDPPIYLMEERYFSSSKLTHPASWVSPRNCWWLNVIAMSLLRPGPRFESCLKHSCEIWLEKLYNGTITVLPVLRIKFHRLFLGCTIVSLAYLTTFSIFHKVRVRLFVHLFAVVELRPRPEGDSRSSFWERAARLGNNRLSPITQPPEINNLCCALVSVIPEIYQGRSAVIIENCPLIRLHKCREPAPTCGLSGRSHLLYRDGLPIATSRRHQHGRDAVNYGNRDAIRLIHCALSATEPWNSNSTG